nr:hypothetical protein [Kibdelosporangium sp. MJ126-NF4]CTQ98310.1 hypothetical protein [Kibdelosporangium sp. MJ126-NF4]
MITVPGIVADADGAANKANVVRTMITRCMARHKQTPGPDTNIPA